MVGGADSSLYDQNTLSWVSMSQVEETVSYLSTMTFNGQILGKRLKAYFETSVPNITVSSDILS